MSVSSRSHESQDFNDIDRVYVDIRDMSLYSLGLKKIQNGTSAELVPGTSVPTDISSEHILYDTAMRLVVDRCSHTSPDSGKNRKPTINVSGRVTKPLQLVLSNSAYQQLWSTMDTLSGKTDGDSMGSSVHSASSSALTSPVITPV